MKILTIMNYKVLFLFFGLIISANCYSQNEANVWYFGQNAGLDFSSGSPVAITDGQLSTVEGCSSFADSNGDLLFYSDGITVYNKNHQVMQNGNNLGGNPSSSQSGLIVPKPEDPDTFYLFTVGTNAVGNTGLPQNSGFKYYTIDMTANGGLGSVNNGFVNLSGNLSANWTEKVTAVQSDGCSSIWVISLVGNTFYSFLVDANGVAATPVISTVLNFTNDVRGYLKISPNATKIVSANMVSGTYLYDFDNATGIISNGNMLNVLGEFGYGIEFSLNSEVLYVATGNYLDDSTENLYQFDLTLADINQVNNSRTLIQTYVNTRGALQLAPNGKIYWTSHNSNRISVINNPENLGAACNYSHLSVDLGGRTATQGLPPFIQSLFLPNVDIVNDGLGVFVEQIDLCNGSTFSLEPDITSHPSTTTYEWFKDDLPLMPLVTTSFLTIDSVIFGTGIYKVLINFNDGITCPFYGEAQVDYHPNPIITSPITIKQCDDDTDGIAIVDLTLANESVSTNFLTETFTYFNSQADAENGDVALSIQNSDNYTTSSTGANPLWVRVEDQYCYAVGEVNIVISSTNTNFNRTLYKCDDYVDATQNDYDGISEFDLTQVENDLLQLFPAAQQPNLNFSYYLDINNAQLQTNQITNPNSYRNVSINTATIPERIFIRVNNNSNIDCAGMGINLYIDLVVEELPVANMPNNMRACETVLGSNQGEFDTTNITNLVLQGQTNVSLTYLEDDGNGNLIQIPNTVFLSESYVSQSKTITVVAINNNTNDPNGACSSKTTFDLIVDDLPVANPVVIQPLCDDFPNQTDGMSVFDTSTIQSAILQDQLPDNMEIHYYYQDGTEILPTLPEHFNTVTQTIRVEVVNVNNSNCTATTNLFFEIVNDSPIFDVSDQLLCINLLPTLLEVQVENYLDVYTYVWEDERGNVIPTNATDTSIALITKAGQYSVTATSLSQCTTTKIFTVAESSIPKIETITIFDDLPNNRISVLVSGIGDYEFALDNEEFVDGNELKGHVFYNVTEGLHTIRINDKKGCTPIIETEVIVIRFPRHISPNHDGHYDEFYVYGGEAFLIAVVTIFDRYGKVIRVLNNNEKWDGTYLGKIALETDYWFLAKFIDAQGKTYERKGHFSLKL